MTVSTESLREQFIKAGNKMMGTDSEAGARLRTTQPAQPKSTHPEASKSGQDEIPSMVSEKSFIVEGQIYDAKINSQKLQQKKHSLRGHVAKTEKKKLWADRQEVERDIEKDNLDASKQRRTLNREGHVQSLAAKSYTVERTRSVNDGRRQALVNEGISLKLDHTQGFDAAVGRTKKEEGK